MRDTNQLIIAFMSETLGLTAISAFIGSTISFNAFKCAHALLACIRCAPPVHCFTRGDPNRPNSAISAVQGLCTCIRKLQVCINTDFREHQPANLCLNLHGGPVRHAIPTFCHAWRKPVSSNAYVYAFSPLSVSRNS